MSPNLMQRELLVEYTRPDPIEMPWINPHAEVFNYQKHRETCTKNRKKRKSKRK
jgi:hypothetical protein